MTNRRALIVEQGFRGRKTTSAYLSDLNIVDKRIRNAGIGDIAFNGPVTNRWRSGRNNPPEVPMFRDVDDAESVFRMVEQLRTGAEKSRLGPRFGLSD